jgi:hypothetical protein
MPKGLWAIETCNGNSWDSFKNAMLNRSKADIVIAQETKILSDGSVNTAQRQARRLGWNPILSRAHRTSLHHGSGGCATVARAGIGIAPAPQGCIHDDLQHRLQVTWIAGVCKGGIHILNVYLKDSEGLSPTNMHILEQAAICLKALKGPWIAGGDWNLEPQELEAAGWLSMVGGVVHAPSQPTCHGRVYDFFVVHKAISPAVAGVQRLDDGGLYPHFPTRLLVEGGAHWYMVRRLNKRVTVPGHLPAGPPSAPPSYNEVFARVEVDPNAAMIKWYTQARTEFSDLMGTQCTFKLPSFSWRRASDTTNPAAEAGVSTLISRTWRILEQKARLVCRIVFDNRSTYNEHTVLAATARSMFKVHLHLPSKAKLEVGPVVHGWATAFWRAVASAQMNTAHSLRGMAGAKARTIEAATLKLNMSKWKQAIGASSAEGKAAKPNRLSYRWVKGLEGWAPSKIAPNSWNDGCEHECSDIGHHAEQQLQDLTEDTFDVPLSDQGVVDNEAEEWAALWQQTAQYVAPAFEHDSPHAKPLV